MDFVLELSDLSKSYGNLLANDSVSIKIKKGNVHALLGENGAGKSTLVKIIYGIIKQDSGVMRLNGELYSPKNPHIARQNGIGMVFQHFSLFESLTVLENIVLGQDSKLSKQIIYQKLEQIKEDYNLFVDEKKIIATLSAGEKQKVEIIRCLLQDPKVLILDEPTSVLSPSEITNLFELLKKLSSTGVVVVYISHKLHEIKLLCDEATILRNGKVVKSCDPKKETINSLANYMIGHELNQKFKLAKSDREIVFEVSNLNYQSQELYGTSLKDINFNVNKGEILGIGGIAGNGQKELMELLSGEIRTPDKGSIVFNKTNIENTDINFRRSSRIAFIPEDRDGHSAVAKLSLVENVLITNLWNRELFRGGVINEDIIRNKTKEIIDLFQVKCDGIDCLASSLSGGNLQKFVVGREFTKEPRLIICEQPTWGVDAGSASMIHQFLLEKVNKGSSIVVISQDIDELMKISHRMGIISNGRLSKLYKTDDISSQDIALEMAS
tara:strand:+ start:1051 stop:2541 length:1491 start_codon:yes stop_codon:yes gene_type:complete